MVPIGQLVFNWTHTFVGPWVWINSDPHSYIVGNSDVPHIVILIIDINIHLKILMSSQFISSIPVEGTYSILS